MNIKGLNIKGLGISTFDADALNFLSVTGITDSNQRNAVNNLVIQMKANNIWNDMEAVYPFVGGTATTHKYNLKDPQDTDAAHRMIFFGGWTHSAEGAHTNGTNAYSDPKVFFGFDTSWKNDTSLGIFMTDDRPLQGAGLTPVQGGISSLGIDGAVTGVAYFSRVNTINASRVWWGNAVYVGNPALIHLFEVKSSRGGTFGSRSNPTENVTLSNGFLTTVLTNVLYPGTIGNDTDKNYLFLGALHDEAGHPGARAGTYREGTYGFYFIGRGLSNKQLSDFYKIVEGFNTQLGR